MDSFLLLQTAIFVCYFVAGWAAASAGGFRMSLVALAIVLVDCLAYWQGRLVRP